MPLTNEGLPSTQGIRCFIETIWAKVCTSWKCIKKTMPADLIRGVSRVAISPKNAPSYTRLKVSKTVHSSSAVSMISSSQQGMNLALHRINISSCLKSTSAQYPFRGKIPLFSFNVHEFVLSFRGQEEIHSLGIITDNPHIFIFLSN